MVLRLAWLLLSTFPGKTCVLPPVCASAVATCTFTAVSLSSAGSSELQELNSSAEKMIAVNPEKVLNRDRFKIFMIVIVECLVVKIFFEKHLKHCDAHIIFIEGSYVFESCLCKFCFGFKQVGCSLHSLLIPVGSDFYILLRLDNRLIGKFKLLLCMFESSVRLPHLIFLLHTVIFLHGLSFSVIGFGFHHLANFAVT